MSSPLNPYDPPQTPSLEEKFSDQRATLAPATSVRYRIIGLTMAMSVLLYLDRFCIGAVTSNIITDLKLDKAQFGWAIGLFFWSYALFQVPAGWLCDVFGSRKALLFYVLGWSAVTICLGFANSLWMFLLLRVLLGVAQAGAYPSAAGYIKKWIPLAGRARANSMVTMGGRFGGVVSNFTPLLMVVLGLVIGTTTELWRVVFVLYGLLGGIWAVFFWFQFRETPRQHPACNAAEVELVEQGIISSTAPPALPWRAILTHPNVWLLSIAGFFINIGWIFLVSWLTPYLTETYGADLARQLGAGSDPKAIELAVESIKGPLTAITGVCGVIGSITGGILADFLLRRFGPIWGRRVPCMVAACIAAGVYLISLFVDNVWIFLVLMSLIYFLTDLGLGALWATYQDFGGKYVSSVLGFANMCGNLGAALFAIVIGYLAKADLWPVVFMLSSGSFLIVASMWLFVDPTHQLVPEEKQSAV
ncbi:MAG: MFS transporter [Pirellulaceae bacterium]|nr:MFS transporter [Pirellulaceae bacterium]